MIGHKDDRYCAFGWAAARLDDLIDLPASRLAALSLILAALLTPGASARDAARAVIRDASRHRSPNAGWPKPRWPARWAFMGARKREADVVDIKRALALYRLACIVEGAALAGAALITRA
jgi:adenosylcobinamide-phosphate synthase